MHPDRRPLIAQSSNPAITCSRCGARRECHSFRGGRPDSVRKAMRKNCPQGGKSCDLVYRAGFAVGGPPVGQTVIALALLILGAAAGWGQVVYPPNSGVTDCGLNGALYAYRPGQSDPHVRLGPCIGSPVGVTGCDDNQPTRCSGASGPRCIPTESEDRYSYNWLKWRYPAWVQANEGGLALRAAQDDAGTICGLSEAMRREYDAAHPPDPTPTPTATPQPTPPPGPGCASCCPPPVVCPEQPPPPPRIVPCSSLLSARARQTLRVAPSWTLVEQRKAWLRAVEAEVAALRCVEVP